MGVSLIGKKKDAYGTAQKSVIEPTLKCAQLLAPAILDQSEKHLETSVVENQEVDVIGNLEPIEVQAAEVMVGLKTVEASDVPDKFVSETIAHS